MLQSNVDSGKYQEHIDRAVDYVENLGFENVRARYEGYEEPASLRMQGTGKTFTPDITATKNGGKYYFEIADRGESTSEVVGKWKLMATLAEMKGGDFRIFVPYGSMKYTNDILTNKSIKAEIIKLPR